jgi:hypothetical protein
MMSSLIKIKKEGKRLKLRSKSEIVVAAIAEKLIMQSRWFEVTPLMDGIWEITLKDEARDQLKRMLEHLTADDWHYVAADPEPLDLRA